MGIIALFICTGITPSVAIDTIEQSILPISNGKTLYVGGSGEGNYTMIQDAVDDANDGDTVFVFNGTYYENIIIKKSINLIGENKDSTIIVDNFSHSASAVTIKKINVTITCFTIIGEATAHGIEIYCDYSKLFNNNISSGVGIVINSKYNSIIKNYIIADTFWSIDIGDNFNDIIDNTIIGITGIWLEGNSNNIINNSIYCGKSGIRIMNANQNIISNNTMDKGGFFLQFSSYNNFLYSNYVNNKPILFLHNESNQIFNQDFGQIIIIDCNNITIENQELYDLTIGIHLIKSNNCKIKNNIITNPNKTTGFAYGIKVNSCENTNLMNNTISYHVHGINIEYSNKNLISNNNIVDCAHGIFLKYCNDSKIIKNNIFSIAICIEFYFGSRNSTVTMNNFKGRPRPLSYVTFHDPINANNLWFRNYWGRPRILPKLIVGYLILDEDPYYPKQKLWFEIDWRPALRPFNIEM